ncbi:MFS transporter [Streptomyces sp. AV19]|uniref:MFS transporter n=1 Tax=Streptomyces sp. AV19 TaxID=2793068 RepID=UPI0018FEC05E|nr:MFS transporter [Streptomyces sp. AV19]MBH1935919.1 MFS transporter [Streptomyces sp. AV19]MDG4534298.1 MFS transporter [Streptomyces sp. AV19]
MPVAALAALALSVFALCSAEFALIGLLLDVSRDLRVSVASTGQLLSAYAVTVAVGGPVVTVLTTRVAPKRLALGLLAVFAAANVLGALAPSFPLLLAARTLGALTHSTFAAICVVIAVRLAPPGRRASAIAWVSGGLGLATVLGGPIGTAIGQQWGWRATFWCVTGAAAVGFLAVLALVPGSVAREAGGSARGALKRPQVLCALAVTTVSQAGWFLLYSFVAPLLRQAAGFGATATTVMLFVFGLGGFAGNAVGGRLADRTLRGALVTMLLLLAGALALTGAVAHVRPAVPVAILLIGFASGALVPPLQTWVLGAAGGGSALAVAANTSAFNLGNAAGSWGGSQLLDVGADVTVLGWAGAGVVAVALAVTAVALRRGF